MTLTNRMEPERDYLPRKGAMAALTALAVSGCLAHTEPQITEYVPESLPEKWEQKLEQGVRETEEGYYYTDCVGGGNTSRENHFMMRSRTGALQAINAKILRNRKPGTSVSVQGEVYGVEMVDQYLGKARLKFEHLVQGMKWECREFFAPKVNKHLNKKGTRDGKRR